MVAGLVVLVIGAPAATAHEAAGAGGGPGTAGAGGGVATVTSIVATLGLFAVATLLLPPLVLRPVLRGRPGGLRRGMAAAPLGLGAVLLLAVRSQGPEWPALPTAVLAVHLLAAAVWVGTVVHLLVWWRKDPAAIAVASRRVMPVVSVAIAVVVITGTLNTTLHLEGAALLGDVFSRLVLLKLLIVVVAVAATLLLRRRNPTGGLVIDLVLLTGAAVIGAALGTLPDRFPFPRPVGPVVLAWSDAGGPTTALITPGFPGPNRLVVLRDDGRAPVVSLGGAAVALQAQPEGGWAAKVALEAGPTSLVVDGRPTVVRTRPPGDPDVVLTTSLSSDAAGGPQCASRLLGQEAAVAWHNRIGGRVAHLEVRARGASSSRTGTRVPGCSEALIRDDEETAPRIGQRLASYLAHRGIRLVDVVADGSRRSRALLRGLGEQPGATLHVRSLQATDVLASTGDAVVVATDWAQTPAVLARLRGTPNASSRPLVLAPWLLTRGLLEAPAGDAGLGQLSVATVVDPGSDESRAYLRELARLDPEAEPSAAGLAGFVDVLRVLSSSPVPPVPSDRSVQLVAPLTLGFLPPALDGGHQPRPDEGWVRGGSLVAVSSALPIGRT